MRLHWVTLTDQIGIGLGYSTHQKMLYLALRRAGVEMDKEAPVAIHISTPDAYQPVPGKKNVLYTMYECTTLPQSWIDALPQADLIVVPCRHNRALFQRYTTNPVEVCWEGIDPSLYPFTVRTFPKDRPFQFLWVGATNPRKGTEHVMHAWERWIRAYAPESHRTMLVMKTTQETARKLKVGYEIVTADNYVMGYNEVEEEMPAERIVRCPGNAFVDTRRLPANGPSVGWNPPGSLREMYESAHAFLFPTRGEGFGLTLAEAAATGLPCLYTDWSGPRDFMPKGGGYTLKWELAPVKTIGWRRDGTEFVSHETAAASCDIDGICRKMWQVYSNYEEAVRRAKIAADHIRTNFTWDISARSFIELIDSYQGQWGLREAA